MSDGVGPLSISVFFELYCDVEVRRLEHRECSQYRQRLDGLTSWNLEMASFMKSRWDDGAGNEDRVTGVDIALAVSLNVCERTPRPVPRWLLDSPLDVAARTAVSASVKL